jgi:hypothetical protein
MRKCVFLPVPPEAQEFIRNLPPPKPFDAVPFQPGSARPATPAPRKRDPKKDARAFDAISPDEVKALQRRKMMDDARNAALGRKPADSLADVIPAWYEDPIALGSLLILIPPVGLAALWTSKKYSSDARWALTVMTGITMCLAASVLIAIVALQTR